MLNLKSTDPFEDFFFFSNLKSAITTSVCFKVWLCYDAALSEQNQCYEAVGAAMDKELSVWRPLEKDP